MIDYLFLDSNRTESGKGLEKGKRQRFSRALFFARQLVNAGFYYKSIGVMPEKLVPEYFSITENDFLFLNRQRDKFIEFDESRFLSNIKGFFHHLIFGEFSEKNSLSLSVKNYSRSFTTTVDSLDKSGHSLVSFLFIIDELNQVGVEDSYNLLHFRIDSSIFEGFIKENSQSVFYIVPDTPVSSVFGNVFEITSIFDSSQKSIPFGSYNRFAKTFFYLELPVYTPDRLPDVDLMWKRIKPALDKFSENIVILEKGESLDSFSIEIFKRIASEIKGFKVVVLEKAPLSSLYNNLMEEGICTVFNPLLKDRVEIINYIFPEYSFQTFLSRVKSVSNSLFIPFFQMMAEGKVLSREELLKKAGVSEKDIKRIKQGKEREILRGKGFFIGDKFVFPLTFKPHLEGRLTEVIKEAENGNLNPLIKEIPFLKRRGDKREIAQYISSQKEISDSIKGIFWYCADNYKKALLYWKNSNERELFPFIVEAMFFMNKFEDVVSFCNKNKFFPPYYYFILALNGEDVSEEKLNRFCLLELAYRKHNFERLKSILDATDERDGLYYRFLAIYYFFHSHSSGFKKYFEKAVEVAREENNFIELALIYKYYGNVMYYTEDFFASRDLYLKAMQIAVDIENEGIFKDVEYNMAHIDISMCKLDRSYKYFYRLYLREKNTANYRVQIYLLKALSKINVFAVRLKEAENFLFQALELAKKHNLKSEFPQLHFVLITIYQDMRDFEKSEYYLELFEKESDIELFKREIIYKRIEINYCKGDFDKARKFFKEWELKKQDKLQPFIYKWFKILLFNPTLADVFDFYFEVEECPLRHTVFLMKSELIKKFPNLVFVIDDSVLERDYRIVRQFNREFADIYRQAITRKKKTRFEPFVFELLDQLLSSSLKGEFYSVKRVVEELGNWLGLNVVDIMPFSEGLTRDWNFVLCDDNKRMCIVSDTYVDTDFYPLFRLMLNIIASHIQFVYSSHQMYSESFDCDFLNEIVGKSEAIRRLKKEILKVADFNVPVLVMGESGTGKELVARALHYCSKRRRRKFIPINCAAIPDNLLESELFGYEKGAFSGAFNDKRGILEMAGDGTVFLDEIGEMSPLLQAKLLRVLQEREFTPLGSTRVKKVNARFVFATNRDLKKLVKEGKFREDLYFRISGYVIKTPSLKERREDIPLLAMYFLNTNEEGKGKSFSEQFLNILKNYDFRGNVRELQNIVLRAIILSGEEDVIDIDHLPEHFSHIKPKPVRNFKDAVSEFKKELIVSALEKHNYNKKKAAEELGLSRQALHNYLRDFGLLK